VNASEARSTLDSEASGSHAVLSLPNGIGLTYPVSRRGDVVDYYHGVAVSDPYQWLEIEESTERAAWIASQNALTSEYLVRLGARSDLRQRFEELLRYQRRYDLVRRGPYLVFKQNDGLSPQPKIYCQRGLDGTPELLVDFNEIQPGLAVRPASFELSRDGAYLAYGFSPTGGDCEEYRVKDMSSRQDLPERIQGVKTSRIAWQGHGFYYCRYQTSGSGTTVAPPRDANHQVWYHSVGTAQSEDRLVYEDAAHPLRLHFVITMEDEHRTLLSVLDPSGGQSGNALAVLDADKAERGFMSLVPQFDHQLHPIGCLEDRLVVLTDRSAPNRQIVLIDPLRPDEEDWDTLVPEREHPIERARFTAGRLFVLYRKPPSPSLCVFDQTGSLRDVIAVPGPGLVQVFDGQRGDKEALWSFANFTTPPTIHRYDIEQQRSTVFHMPQIPCDLQEYETTRVHYSSKDGTQVPMYIVHRKRLQLDGSHALLLYGYGGSANIVDPAFDPLLLALLERGVIFAAAGLRGGGEHGEAWHRAGCREKKQNVFDDCIAAGEWLQASGYTSRDRCGLIGASNGGLLVGAVITQRPDLFRVALPCAGILDMLRYHCFTIGWAFADEYGTSEDPLMFPILSAYSPLHNVRNGIEYPATLASTCEHDDRVVAAHSFKFIATLQHEGVGTNPYLIRVAGGSGHGAVTLREALDERADLYAFFLSQVAGAPNWALLRDGQRQYLRASPEDR
jgi:prolyl oligopeptidase